jgi:ubiquinone/menaquinone biosynthesis C-methylase UbiE
MKRIDAPEILDSDACSPREVELSMQDMGRVNRWFGGVATTQRMLERIAAASGCKQLSVLEVAAGSGEVPRIVARRLARQGINVQFTLLDRAQSHLPRAGQSLVADALALPFGDAAFDAVSCNLFVHHLSPALVGEFAKEAMRVSRIAVLINDLVRHPLHLALAFSGLPLMRSRVAWRDGLTSVRRAYLPEEMREMILAATSRNGIPRVEISRHYLYRMGVMVWKAEAHRGGLTE